MTAPKQEPRCAWCGRVLRDEDSIAAGYGPICEANVMGRSRRRTHRARPTTSRPAPPHASNETPKREATPTGVPELVREHLRICVRSGPGRGTDLVAYSRCTGCGWVGEPWDGDQPPLTDGAHVCGDRGG